MLSGGIRGYSCQNGICLTFCDRILDCGEDLLVDLSEVLFNELAFFRLMQNLNHAKSKVKTKLLNWKHVNSLQ